MQAITTKFFGPTNRLGARVKAYCERGSLTVSWDYALGIEQNHRAACDALLAKFAKEDCERYNGTSPSEHHWGEFVTGQTRDSMVHVLLGRR
jgi:hypothetical protein